MRLSDITLVLGVDAKHLEELRLVWPGWMQHKPELREMPCVVFYDKAEVKEEELAFLSDHPDVRWVPWELPNARSQREKMLTGFIHISAREVKTTWYLKIDTDVIATGPGQWIKEEWFEADDQGEVPVFIASPWGYSKPRYVMDLLDDWADHVPELAERPRLNLPYSSRSNKVRHARIISWLFFGLTQWTREMTALAGKDGRLPFPSQDSYLFFCAERLGRRYLRVKMSEHGWKHQRPAQLKKEARRLGGGRLAETSGQLGKHGVLYYNLGRSCAVRLLVSLHSLRKHYSGPVAILSEGEESHRLCQRIAAACGARVIEWDAAVETGKNMPFLAKTRLHLGTPFEVTVALDSDTLVLGPLDELFVQAERDGFCVARFANWRTSGGIMQKRIRQWSEILPGYIEAAVNHGPAINTGVMVFRQDASLFRQWYETALRGREYFIPDEVSCQLLLPRHPHFILDGKWNRSCKHDDPDLPDTRIIHYHGKKHCRPGLPYHGDKWMAVYDEVVNLNLAGVRDWSPAGDRMLKRYLKRHRHTSESFGGPEKVILGAGKTSYPGWVATDKQSLDVTEPSGFERLLNGKSAIRFLAEHVWEHLSDDDLARANQMVFRFLAPGGCVRIAVPDGCHPDEGYRSRVTPGGSGPSAWDHKQLFTHISLAECLEKAGFRVEKLEHWDEHGEFHRKPWRFEDGPVKRSAEHDRRNRRGKLAYTSLIVDAWKPL